MSSWPDLSASFTVTDRPASQVFGDNMNFPVAPPQGLHCRYRVKRLNNDQVAVKVVTDIQVLFRLKCNNLDDSLIFLSSFFPSQIFEPTICFTKIIQKVTAKVKTFPSESALICLKRYFANDSMVTC